MHEQEHSYRPTSINAGRNDYPEEFAEHINKVDAYTKIDQSIERLSRRAHDLGLPYPTDIDVYFYPSNKSVDGSVVIGRKNDQSPIKPNLFLPISIIEQEPWLMDAIVAHEFGHLIDFSMHAKEHGISTDLSDMRSFNHYAAQLKTWSEALERRAVRYSCQLVEDPNDILRCYNLSSQHKLSHGITQDGQIKSRPGAGVINAVISGSRNLTRGAIHPGLRSIAHEVKTYCEKHDLPIDVDQDAFNEALSIDQKARKMQKETSMGWLR